MNLVSGGWGFLGHYLKTSGHRPSHKRMDITENPINWDVFEDYDLIIHCAAYSKVAEAEVDKKNCFNANVNGTLNLLLNYPHTPFVFISSEYAHNPVNFYGLTKKIGEQLVKTHTAPYLIIRTLFKPYPYPYQYAFINQYTQGDYVTVIAPLIDKEIMDWDRKTSMIIYVGTGRKTMFELAKRSKPDVKSNLTTDIKGVNIPNDYQ